MCRFRHYIPAREMTRATQQYEQMNTLSISVGIDRKAALLAGLVLAERETIEVSPETIGPENWPLLVASLDMDKTPAHVGYVPALPANTVEALRAALDAIRAKKDAEAVKDAEAIAKYLSDIEATAVAPMTPVTKRVSNDGTLDQYGPHSINGFERKFPYVDFWNLTPENKAAFESVKARKAELVAASDAEVSTANEAALAEQWPAVKAAHEAKIEADRVAKETADAAKKAADKAKFWLMVGCKGNFSVWPEAGLFLGRVHRQMGEGWRP